MPKVNIAIAINIVDEALALVEKRLAYLLSEHKIKFIKNMQNSPHITLCIGSLEIEGVEPLYQKLEKILSKHKSFTLSGNGLGVFLKKKPNLHLRWIENGELFTLKNSIEKALSSLWQEEKSFNDVNVWVAKTSLAYEDFDYKHISSIDFDTIKLENVDMKVRKISIIKFENMKKEEELYEITLNEEDGI